MIESKAGRFRYLEARGRGSTRPRGALVLIHGFPLNARMWEPQLQPLAEAGWQVLAPHLRGFDDGDEDPPASSIDDYAADVIDLLDALHVQDAVVGGLSMGGYVALALFRLAPRYIRGLVLADTRSQADTPEGVEGRRKMLGLLAEQGVDAVINEMMPKLLSEATRRERLEVVSQVRTLARSSSRKAIAEAIAALMTRPDSTPLLPAIHCPTLVIVGDQDAITPPAVSEELHRGIPGSELVVIPQAGHMSNLEQPDAFNDALARFLEHRV